MNLSDTMDKMMFEIISENSPDLIREIREALKEGLSAKQIEARLVKTYRGQSDVANSAVHAAHYLQNNPSAQQIAQPDA